MTAKGKALVENPQLVVYTWATGWAGQFPTYMASGSGSSAVPVIPLPSMPGKK